MEEKEKDEKLEVNEDELDVEEEEDFEVKKRDLNKKDKDRSIPKLIGNIIFWLIFLVFAICAMSSYLSFNKVEDNKEPSYYREKRQYQEENKNVTVYDYYVYKIVKVVDNVGTKVSLKLWFLEDINKEEE